MAVHPLRYVLPPTRHLFVDPPIDDAQQLTASLFVTWVSQLVPTTHEAKDDAVPSQRFLTAMCAESEFEAQHGGVYSKAIPW